MRDVAAGPFRHATETWLGAGHGIAVQQHVLDFSTSLHWHEFFELSYVTAGTGHHTINGESRPLAPGDVLALTPADFHETHPHAGQTLRITNVVYTDGLLPDELRAALPAAPTVRLPELAADFDRMVTDSCRPDLLSALSLRATLARLLADVVRIASTDGAAEPWRGDRRADVQRAVSWIDHHFREPIRLADAAAIACLSPHHFCTLFRQTSGVSFQEYLIARRLNFARALLAASDHPVTQVCHAAGFNDLTHFSRSYRRRFGQPPSAHRGPARARHTWTAAPQSGR